jgi:ABC-type branched-subunit amino acid transport system substrate-binding protein
VQLLVVFAESVQHAAVPVLCVTLATSFEATVGLLSVSCAFARWRVLCAALAVGRTHPSDAVYVQVLPRMISTYGWTNIAVLHSNDDYANNNARGMQANSAAAGVNVVTTSSYEPNDASTYSAACAAIAASGVNIIEVAAWDPDLAQLLTACRSAGPNNIDLLGAGYVWINADAVSLSGAYAAGVGSGLTAAQSAETLDGMLHFYGSPQGTSGYSRFQADWATHGREECFK